MPQITITFDAEERQEALDAINVHQYKAKIDEALEFIHRKLKYDENMSEETPTCFGRSQKYFGGVNMKEKTNKIYYISSFQSLLESLPWILLIVLRLGEPDLLDQLIKIAQNYAETMKCK